MRALQKATESASETEEKEIMTAIVTEIEIATEAVAAAVIPAAEDNSVIYRSFTASSKYVHNFYKQKS